MYPIITSSGVDWSASPTNFVKFWREFYFGSDEIYECNIGKKITARRVLNLFEWKNGKRLPDKTKISLFTNYINNSNPVPENSSDCENVYKYLTQFNTVVWPIFWLHCNHPNIFPIIDQNAYRSMLYCTENTIKDPPAYRQYISDYIHKYIPFFSHFEGVKFRDIDKALWAFGDWLKKQDIIKTKQD